MPDSTPRYGLNTNFTDDVTEYGGAAIARVHNILDAQAGGAVESFGVGVLHDPDGNSLKVAAASGLSATIQPGRCIARHSSLGGCVLVLPSQLTLSSLAPSTTLYVFVAIQMDGDNDSRASGLPLVAAQGSGTYDGGVLVARIVTGSSSITRVEDAREMLLINDLDSLFDYDPLASSGFTFAYEAGRVRNGSAVTAVSAGTVALTSGAVNYVEVDPATGVVSVASGSFTAGLVPLWQVTASSTGIAGVVAARTWAALGGASGVSSVTASGGLASSGGTTPDISIASGGVGDTQMASLTADPTVAYGGTPLVGKPLTLIGRLMRAIEAATGVSFGSAPGTTLATSATHQAAAAPHTAHFDIDGSKPLTGDMDAGGNKLTNLDTPTDAADAVTKAYADALASGLTLKVNVKAATTANIALSGEQTVDAVAVVSGDRVLVKDQTTQSENGIYVASSGAWTRATDADTVGEMPAGTATTALNGAANKGKRFAIVTPAATLETDPIIWTLDSGGGGTSTTIANAGAGAGVWKALSGSVNYLRSIVAGSSKLSVTQNADDITVDVVEANLTLGNLGGTVPVTKGGTGLSSAALGDLLYGSASNVISALGGNSTTTRKFLSQTGTGSASAAPAWDVLLGADLPVMGASGPSHAAGAVPDPGATAGSTRYLCENGTFSNPPASGATTAIISDAVTNAYSAAFTSKHRTSGTPAAGFGLRQSYLLQSTTTVDRDAVDIDAVWTDATDATRSAALAFTVVKSGIMRERMRLGGASNASGIYVPWISGDTQVTALFGSNNTDNDQAALFGQSHSGVGVLGVSSSGYGVTGEADTVAGGRFATVQSVANAINQVLELTARTLGTAVAGFGARIIMQLDSSTTTDQDAGGIDVVWTDATHATRTSKMSLWTVLSGVKTFVCDLAPGGLALLGNPTAPTQTAGDNSTRIATTAYVDSAVSGGGGGAGNSTSEIDVSSDTSPRALTTDEIANTGLIFTGTRSAALDVYAPAECALTVCNKTGWPVNFLPDSGYVKKAVIANNGVSAIFTNLSDVWQAVLAKIANKPPYPTTLDSGNAINTDQVGFYLFNEATSTSLADIAGNSRNGTLQAGVTWDVDTDGPLCAFDGMTNAYISVTDNDDWNITDTFSVFIRFKTGSDVMSEQGIVSRWDAGGYQWLLEIYSGALVWYIRTPAGASTGRHSTSIATDTTYTVGAVYDGNGLSLDVYLNGSLANGSLSGTIPATAKTTGTGTSSPRIGGVGDTSSACLNGKMGVVRLFKRILSAGDITSLHDNPYQGVL